MKKLKIAVLGLGNMGQTHARSVGQLPNVELVAVADVNAARALQIGEEMNVAAFGDVQSLLDESGCEAVLIATPHPFHREACEAAAKRGVHVLCEKPLAVQVSDADAMVEVCRANNVMLGVVFQQRAEGSRRAMKKLIEQGAIGEIYRIAMTAPWYRPQVYYNSGAWRGTWSGEGGGILMNQAPHSMDQMIWLGGAPKSVQALASTRLHTIEVENSATALIEYSNGATATFTTSTAEVLGFERIEVYGDRGVLRWENGKLQHYAAAESLSENLKNSDQPFGIIGGEWHDVEPQAMPEFGGATPSGSQSVGAHNAIVASFADAVLSHDESKLIARGEDGVASLELADAILLAGVTHQKVQFSLDRQTYANVLQKLQSGALKIARA